MNFKDFLKGLGIGAVAGVVTGILTAPKSGKETRADIARFAKTTKIKLMKEAKRVKELTEDKYNQMVDVAIKKYKNVKKFTKEEIDNVKEQLKKEYKNVKKSAK